jgi:hypothetical protein
MPPLINISDFEPLRPLGTVDGAELPWPEFRPDGPEPLPWALV